MSEGKQSRLSPAQKAEVWNRWKAGEWLHEIGRAYGKPHNCIRCVLLSRGGIAPAAPQRSGIALTLAEREDISRGIASGSSIRTIASGLGRSASTVSREVTRHGGRAAYRAHDADRQAWKSALRPKRCLLAGNRKLRNMVASKLIQDWSPEQISGWLKTQYPDDQSMRVSQETIYRSLFIQARGVLKQELIKVPGKDTEAVVQALSWHVRKLPATLRRSLTWDRGLEMARHKEFTVATKVKVYFCDPQSPWERGTNENTNLLLRQYFRRGTDLAPISQAQLDQVALRLNQRPRKTLGYQTPAARLQASVASTV